ncbi:MAG: phosphatase PAP2 family protein [Ignavibacteriales bacterium]|nr:phosphatase PAP2 family protein [Ignavibacteriales bacterium]
MADALYQIDVAVFYFINGTISNPLFDKFFVFITDVKNWYLTYLILLLISFFKGGRIGKIATLMTILLVVISDQASSTLLKNLFERVRPCNVLPDVNILVGCTSSFSFPSSHAVNNFAAAFYFGKIFPRIKWILLVAAFIVALSRPYVGVHYPSDIFGGAVIGSIVGYLFALLVIKIDNLFQQRSTKLTSRLERIEFK